MSHSSVFLIYGGAHRKRHRPCRVRVTWSAVLRRYRGQRYSSDRSFNNLQVEIKRRTMCLGPWAGAPDQLSSVSLSGQSEHLREQRSYSAPSKNSELYSPAAATVFPGGP